MSCTKKTKGVSQDQQVFWLQISSGVESLNKIENYKGGNKRTWQQCKKKYNELQIIVNEFVDVLFSVEKTNFSGAALFLVAFVIIPLMELVGQLPGNRIRFSIFLQK